MPDYGLPWVPANTNPRSAAYANGRRRSTQSNFYGLADARLREDRRPTSPPCRSTRDFSEAAHAAQPDALRAQRPRLGDHRAALRQRQHEHRHQPAAAVARHGRHDRRQPDRPRSRASAPVASRHAVSAGRRARARDVGELRAQRAGRADRRSVQSRIRSEPYPGPITRTGASTIGHGESAWRPMRSTRSSRRQALRADRRPALGSLRGRVRNRRPSTGVVTPFDRIDTMVSWRAGAVYKPRPNGSDLCRLRHVVQSVGGGAGAERHDGRRSIPRRRATSRSAPSGICMRRAAVVERGALPHRQDQRAHARHQSRRSADRAGRRAGACDGVELGVSGRLTRRLVGLQRLRVHAQRHRRVEHGRPSSDNALALTPEHTLSLWTTYDVCRSRVASAAARSTWTAVFRNATNTAAGPELLAVQRDGVVRGQRAPDAPRSTGSNLADERVRRSRRRRPLHPGPGRRAAPSLVDRWPVQRV